ncbi:LexA-binding, inner membrane-associated putative hydrolase [Halohasta litchfieldiae]|jgi:hypothetical protein|uniref:LexA-binding, inner membrane-associated putative hydrolase n=1 Tax=Halohasta litchfieldiae TaxID=1073996 RepID=A0A1H6QX19_9EURY|nr:metal-dependent hydrolase [Halohasta litchfieldiae]ATW88585.1 LexA-binding, inner membrane-associated putative hydrolase [Halohasta litchfieldiae]SEI48318.1 LexA-binding, inner membrane-associated putative hydrolase [Halohasta litchfieldiae]
MWPLGHAAVAYLCYTGLCRAENRLPESLAVVALLIGSQTPDLVDKPLSWYLGVLPTGRSLAHSLLVLGPLIGVVYLLAARSGRAEYGIAFSIGALSHLLADSLPALWGGTDGSYLLWPLLAVEPYESGPPSILALFTESLGQPYFLAEFVLAGLAVAVWQRDGYPVLSAIRRRLARGVQ